jgi:hypothetical protein
MATPKNKKVEEKPAPVISKLPIPISDSPLVIDLPDGQKLVVGKMIQGTVIEVATWRGTGRPDSRTSRLMLGMSVGDVNPAPETPSAPNADGAPSPTSAAPRPTRKKSSNPRIAQVQEVLFAIIDHPLFKKLFGKPAPKASRKKAPIAPATASTEAVSSPMPAAPVSPFAQPVAAPTKKGIFAKLFGPSPKKPRKVKPAKGSGPIRSGSPVTSVKDGVASDVDDISAWLDEISNKAKAKVESAEVREKSSAAVKKSASKPVSTAKKTTKPVKKSAAVAKNRK